jgi:hypothetical protein
MKNDMKADIAVATVSGKAYYLIISELRKRSLPFVSLTPFEPVPTDIKVVITTEGEKQLINHDKVLVYTKGADLEALMVKVLQTIRGKEGYSRIVVGVDPGEVLGLAILGDGKVIEAENCFSVEETSKKINNAIKNLGNASSTSISVKVGDGVPAYKEELLKALDDVLPEGIILESVGEAGTSRFLDQSIHRRGPRDIASAIRIAGRNGHSFQRRKKDESNS